MRRPGFVNARRAVADGARRVRTRLRDRAPLAPGTDAFADAPCRRAERGEAPVGSEKGA